MLDLSPKVVNARSRPDIGPKSDAGPKPDTVNAGSEPDVGPKSKAGPKPNAVNAKLEPDIGPELDVGPKPDARPKPNAYSGFLLVGDFQQWKKETMKEHELFKISMQECREVNWPGRRRANPPRDMH
ncbi:hypothetical protein CDL15_Pgr006369 [Punica granatum]|uniref:Uncharacterized protein n=1 Tax=Punica granatum TaxID=22663 RepID=A0A218VUP5_PUNGR|nr:hypothetical protein CDL15_Pgr006369 [Punica granatum]